MGSKQEPAAPEMVGPDIRRRKETVPALESNALKFISDRWNELLDTWPYVFEENKARTKLLGEPDNFVKKAASLPIQALARTRQADVLAREASIDEIDINSQMLRSKRSDIVPDGSQREISTCLSLQKESLGPFVVLTVGDWSDPGSQGNVDPSDSAK